MTHFSAKHTAYFDMVDSFRKALGCALCEMEVRATRAYLENVLYECVNDHGVRRDLVQAKGYCRRHAHLLLAFGDGLGTAILYRFSGEGFGKEKDSWMRVVKMMAGEKDVLLE